VLFFLFIAGVWAIICAAAYFRAVANPAGSQKLTSGDVVLGILAAVIFVIYLFGFLSICTKRLRLVRHYSWLSAVAAGLVITACVLQIVFLAVWKSDWMDICEDRNDNNWDEDDDGPLEDWCDSRHNRVIWTNVGWTIFLSIAALFIYAISISYYHQERNPSLTRQAQAPSASYRMDPYGQDPPFVPPGHQGAYPAHAGGYSGYDQPYGMAPPPPDYKRHADEGEESVPTPPAGGTFAPPTYPPPQQAQQPHAQGRNVDDDPYEDVALRSSNPMMGGRRDSAEKDPMDADQVDLSTAHHLGRQ